MSAPLYQSRIQSNGLGQIRITDVSTGEQTAAAMSGLGQATARFGNVLGDIAVQQQNIQTASVVGERRRDNFRGLDGINEKYQNDPDMATMPERYEAETLELQQKTLSGLPDHVRAELEPVLDRQRISYVQGARTLAMRKQADGFVAGVDQDYQRFARQYAVADTDTTKQSVITDFQATLDSGVKRGMITRTAAEAYRQSLVSTGDTAIAYRDAAKDPVGTLKKLDDPNYAPGLSPQAREQMRATARGAADDMRVQSETNRARLNPAAAPFISGRITRPEQAEGVFRSIIQQESSGNPNAVSPQGAAGLTQLMPGTAREMAKKAGNSIFDGEDDAGVRGILKADPRLAHQLGLAYFQQNLRQFNGALAPAIAAYHAGTNSRPVMEAHRKATELHGENYTPAQFAALLPDGLADKDRNGNPAKKTKDYVLDIYRRMGADPGGAGLSSQASWRLTNSVDGVIQQQLAEQKQILNQLVQSAGREADALRPVLNDGGQVDPQALASARGALMIGAARGDGTAAEKLRNLDAAIEMRPLVQQAWSMRPDVREGEIAAARAEFTSGKPIDPQAYKWLQVLEGVQQQVATMRGSDSIGLAYRQGLAPAEAIPATMDPASPEFRAAMARRSAVSDRSYAINGGARMVFQPQERMSWKARWNEMGDNERFGLLQTLRETAQSNEAYDTAVKEISGGDAMARIAGNFMRLKPELARDMMRGAALLDHPSVKPKADDLRNAIAGELGGSVFPSEVQKDIIDAATAVYAAERGKTGALYDASDRSGIEAALTRVIGQTVKRNGTRVPLPDDVPPRAFLEAMNGMSAAALDAAGGAYGQHGAKLEPDYVGRHAILKPANLDGRYFVELPSARGTSRVMTAKGKELELDIRDVIRLQRVNTAGSPAARRNQALSDQFRNERRALGIDGIEGQAQ